MIILPNKPEYQNLYIVMNGFLGDQISCLPVLNWIKKELNKRTKIFTNNSFSFFYKETGLFQENEIFDIEKKQLLEDNSFLLYQYNEEMPAAKCHPTIYYPYFWMGNILPKKYKNIPKIKKQDISENLNNIFQKKEISLNDINNFIIISVSSRTKSKSWNKNTILELLKYFQSKNERIFLIGNDENTKKYKEYEVPEKYKSFLSIENIDNQFFNIVNLTNTLSLRDCVFLFQNCKLFITIEGGLAHLASLTDIKMIVGYTLVNPVDRMPYRNDRLGWNIFPVYVEKNDQRYETYKKNSGCKFCMTDMYINYWEFDQCYRKHYINETESFTCTEIPHEKIIKIYEKIKNEK